MVAASALIVAASSFFALAAAVPIRRGPAAIARSLVERNAYQVFGGTGSALDGWPKESDWLSFDNLWNANLPVLKVSCTQYPGSPQNNDDTENANIKDAIQKTAAKSGISPQYILAIMMQESKGCVRAPTTNYGVRNPGLMQDHNGKATCNEGGFTTPCPAATITQMIEEGVGIGTDFGLIQTIAQSGASDVSKYYKGARIYNSGSLDGSGNLGAGIATHCYASDIANRLVGWSSDSSSCQEGTIGSIGGAQGGYQGGGNGQGEQGNNDESNNNNGQTQNPPSTPTEPEPVKGEPTNAQPPSGGQSNPTGPKGQGAADNCTSWYTVKQGDDCRSTGVSFDQLRKLNTGLDATCSNLWLGSSYCIAA